MICRECNRNIPRQDPKYCPYCGSKIESTGGNQGKEHKLAPVWDIGQDTEMTDYDRTVIAAAPQETDIRGYLTVIGTGQSEAIDKPYFTIGKKQDNNLVLDIKTISRKHACIVKEGDWYYIQDLNSSNGTRVEGDPVEGDEKRVLNDGDHIKLANVELIFEVR